MQPMHQDAAGLRRSLLLIVALMAVSTVLFVVGVAVERRGEAAEGAVAHQELSGEPEAGEAAESGEEEGVHEVGAHEEAGSHEEAGGAGEHREESILGLNPDATWVMTAVVVGWTVLAAALLLLGPRVLLLVTLVALSHAVIAVLAVLVLRLYRESQRQQGGMTDTA